MAIEYVNRGLESSLEKVVSSQDKLKTVAIVRGKNSYTKRREIERVIKGTGNCSIVYLDGFSGDPQSLHLLDAAQDIQSVAPDFIIGCGGGSVMDTAKILRIFASSVITRRKFLDALEGGSKIPEITNKVPLLLLPTTAGSGAQCTHFSVVYHEQKKFSLATPALLPDYVIADRELIAEAPQRVLASAAMDALSQSVESFWSQGCTAKSSLLATDAVQLLWGAIVPGILNRDWESLGKLVEASHLAGKAINISKTTGNHALSYKITSDYGVPHGHCVGMLLPEFFELHQRIYESDPRRATVAIERQNDIAKVLGYRAFSDFHQSFKDLLRVLLLDDFDTLKIKNKFDAKSIVSSVNLERLRNHPIALTALDLASIFD